MSGAKIYLQSLQICKMYNSSVQVNSACTHLLTGSYCNDSHLATLKTYDMAPSILRKHKLISELNEGEVPDFCIQEKL